MIPSALLAHHGAGNTRCTNLHLNSWLGAHSQVAADVSTRACLYLTCGPRARAGRRS